MTKVLALAVLLASTVLAHADSTTYTGIACAKQADASTLVNVIAEMPDLTIGAESAAAQPVAIGAECVSLEATSDQVAQAEFINAKGGERVGLAMIDDLHFVFVDGIPPNF